MSQIFKMKNKVKVCHVATRDRSIKFLLLDQLRSLQEDGYEIYVVCSSGKWVEEIKRRGMKVKTVRMIRKLFTPLSDLRAVIKMSLYFKNKGIQIVHTHTPKPGLLGQLAAKIAGVPIIVNTLHGFYFHNNMNPMARRFFILAEKVAAKCSDSILSQNSEDIETAIKEGICQQELIKYLGNGIDIQKFNPNKYSEGFIQSKKREVGIDLDSKIIGIVARFVKDKGFLELFESFRIVKEEFPNTILFVVGPTNMKKRGALSTDIVKNFGIESSVKFLGFREDVDELYTIMDLFVLPSHREGFPRSVMEASSMAKPVVATDIRGCREAVDDGETGILVPVNSPEKLAEAIIYLLENPRKAKRMGMKGREKAEREFDERAVFEKVKNEYNRLIAKKLGS